MTTKDGAPDLTEEELAAEMGRCVLNSSWIFSLLGAAVAVPLGIRKKSLAPLVFYGTTGAMLDIINGVVLCEQKRVKARAANESESVENGKEH